MGLIVLIVNQQPVETGLRFDSLADCYRAEDRMASDITDYINAFVRNMKGPTKQTDVDLMMQRAYRGICVPKA
jgi:hypothetical protein